mmetsp:Transcript_4249/g.8276  ORF Transcript_4249/g.8276 Transcript_4249/m.8276 type:complete len:217 (-) Transcript_4249:2953-3603(-)
MGWRACVRRSMFLRSLFSHLDGHGQARMVDVAGKLPSRRVAVAVAEVELGKEVLRKLLVTQTQGECLGEESKRDPEHIGSRRVLASPKGDVFGVARIAGIQAAKKTHELVPLCHQVPLSAIHVDFFLPTELEGADQTETSNRSIGTVKIRSTAMTDVAKTGVEMEALTAVSIAALTIYDMCKSASKAIFIRNIRLVEKRGGKSDYVHNSQPQPRDQ